MHKPINIAECLHFLGLNFDKNGESRPKSQLTVLKKRISIQDLLPVYREFAKERKCGHKTEDMLAVLRMLDENGSGLVPVARLSELITTDSEKFKMAEFLAGEIDSQGYVNYENLMQHLMKNK